MTPPGITLMANGPETSGWGIKDARAVVGRSAPATVVDESIVSRVSVAHQRDAGNAGQTLSRQGASRSCVDPATRGFDLTLIATFPTSIANLSDGLQSAIAYRFLTDRNKAAILQVHCPAGDTPPPAPELP